MKRRFSNLPKLVAGQPVQPGFGEPVLTIILSYYRME
jgi:hypothetical protein